MPTNMTNMTILKSPEYSCLRICNVDDAKVIVIDRICTCSKIIFQPESNKHRTKTGNQKHTAQRRKIKTESFIDDEITKTNERKQKIIINKVIHFMLFLLLVDWLARTTLSSNQLIIIQNKILEMYFLCLCKDSLKYM